MSPELDARFEPADHDPLIVQALLWDEVVQRRESGYDVDDVVAAANRLDVDDRRGILTLVDAMANSHRTDWPWDEPEDDDAIAASVDPPPAEPVDEASFPDRVHAAWLGRIVGCNLGKPVEWGDHWTVSRIEDYLTRADAYPLTDYIPVLDPMPGGFELNDSWVASARGRIDGSARDDDIDYAILALHLLEQHGADLATTDVGNAWTSLLPLRQVYTAERAAYISLTDGLLPPRTAQHRNPYREWIGAQIRGDVHGWVHPGDPWAAARSAAVDARLSHTANGVYGEMWSAALNAAAFIEPDARSVVERSLAVVPSGSRLAAAVRLVLRLHDEGADWRRARARVDETLGHYSWVHTINNAAVVALGLPYSDGDFTTAVGRTVMSGLDTDSNGATVGAVAGILAGSRGLPPHLVGPLHDRTRSALFGFDGVKISELAARTVALRRRLSEADA